MGHVAHGKVNVPIYAAPCCSSGHGPVPMSPPSGVLPAVRQRMEGGASHQAWVIVVAPGEPFCTANGSYFVFWGLRRACMAGLGVGA